MKITSYLAVIDQIDLLLRENNVLSRLLREINENSSDSSESLMDKILRNFKSMPINVLHG